MAELTIFSNDDLKRALKTGDIEDALSDSHYLLCPTCFKWVHITLWTVSYRIVHSITFRLSEYSEPRPQSNDTVSEVVLKHPASGGTFCVTSLKEEIGKVPAIVEALPTINRRLNKKEKGFVSIPVDRPYIYSELLAATSPSMLEKIKAVALEARSIIEDYLRATGEKSDIVDVL